MRWHPLLALALLAGCATPSDPGPPEPDARAERVEGVFQARAQVAAGTQTHSLMLEGERTVPIPASAEGLHFSIRWSSTAASTDAMRIDLGSDGGYAGQAVGRSPLTMDVPKENLTGSELTILVAPTGAVSAGFEAQFTWQADFSLAPST